MAKHNTTDSLEEQKEKLFEAIEQIRESLDLSDEDMETIKEWGVTLLVAGVSVYVVYRIVRRLFGEKENIFEEKPSKLKKRIRKNSSISGLFKEQLALLVVAYLKQRLAKFLEEKGLLNEERSS